VIHSAEDRLAAYAPGSPVIHGAGAKQQNGRSQEDGPSDDAGRCGCETDEHDAGAQSEGSHSGMQPTTKSRLDRFRDLRQSGVGTGSTGRYHGWVFAEMNCWHGAPFRRQWRQAGTPAVTTQ
jgi:hypothetical protein